MKEVINADEYEFEIRPMNNGSGYGVFLNHENYSDERLLVIRWTITECRSFIQEKFIGKKGTKFNIKVIQ